MKINVETLSPLVQMLHHLPSDTKFVITVDGRTLPAECEYSVLAGVVALDFKAPPMTTFAEIQEAQAPTRSTRNKKAAE